MSEWKAKILIVDDEERIRRLLGMYLKKEGYSVTEAEDGEKGLQKALDQDFDLILLDVMLPGIDGIEVCLRLRQTKTTPIIMLTAKEEEGNRLQGFEAGTDDYMVKPFSPREVIYRVKAILRRTSEAVYFSSEKAQSNNIMFAHLLIEHSAHRVTAGGQEVPLTPMEYELLYYLATSPYKVFTREKLLKDVWNYDYLGDIRTVDTHVQRLRDKFNKVSPEVAKMITTVWGIGYKLVVPK